MALIFRPLLILQKQKQKAEALLIYRIEVEKQEEKRKLKMATQALVSSSLTSSVETARQILGARSAQSPTGSSRKGSFVVRAASTPPVKVCLFLPPKAFFFFPFFPLLTAASTLSVA